MKTSAYIFLTIFILVLTFLGTSYLHELNHVNINKKAGINSHIEIQNFGLVLSTVRDGNSDLTYLSSMDFAHTVNESINYNLELMLIGIILELMVTGIYLKKEKEVDN